MNVFYEEAGVFKVGSILADNTTSLQIEATHGKRSKIKAASIFLRFDAPPLAEFMQQAQAMMDELDVMFLWEYCTGKPDFSAQELAEDYFGHAPKPVETATVLMLLNNNPIHFHKRGCGRYLAAPPEILQAALAGREKKRLALEIQTSYVRQLTAFELPDNFTPRLDNLLYHPDKNTIEWKAIETACQETGLTVPKLLERCGAIPSTHDYHFNQFLFEYFPQGTAFDPAATAFARNDPATLPAAEVTAFSIDDATTTEYDDAFSVTPLPYGGFRIGIHIAMPALGVEPDSPLDRIAAKRLSTVYLPGNKITMLPDSIIQQYTLGAAQHSPALSLYLNVADDFTVTDTFNRIETIMIADNLRHDQLEPLFNEETLRAGRLDYPYAHELKLLWQFACKQEKLRGKEQDNQVNQIDYSFAVENDRVTITERRRGAPIDKVVSELMIFTNAEWGRQLAEMGIAGIYRSKGNGKVRMSLSPAPHQGLGVAQYAWSSSPMRRYVDLINQRQLIAMVSGTAPAYTKESDAILIAMRDFEITYATYAEFQRGMERYWCLRWLQQEAISEADGTVIKENLVKFDRLPLTARVPSLPNLPSGTSVRLEISHIDLIERSLVASFIGKNEH
ncbi:MAG: RNB domain-containing ribonuclease [Nitrosomonas sp.]|nr:RNB domain-containing ribonuclease [Nitrosomonas sp.]